MAKKQNEPSKHIITTDNDIFLVFQSIAKLKYNEHKNPMELAANDALKLFIRENIKYLDGIVRKYKID